MWYNIFEIRLGAELSDNADYKYQVTDETVHKIVVC